MVLDWLVGLDFRAFWNYFNRAVSQREGKGRKKIILKKKTIPSAAAASTAGPFPNIIQISRTPGTVPDRKHPRWSWAIGSTRACY